MITRITECILTKQRTCDYSNINMLKCRNVTAKICSHQMWISCAKSVKCGLVVQSKLVPAIIAAAILLSYLKLNSYRKTSSEELKSL